jgi:hypothetical protein
MAEIRKESVLWVISGLNVFPESKRRTILSVSAVGEMSNESQFLRKRKLS